MPKILVTEPLPGSSVDELAKKYDVTIAERGSCNSEAALIEKISEYEGLLSLLSNPVSERVLNSAPNLKIVANCAVGYNNIDVDTAENLGIRVANTPDVLTDATADLTLALILSVTRRLREAEDYLREGKFDEWMPKGFLGFELSGSRIGIVGLGRIGKAVAKRARAFGMEVGYFSRNRANPETEQELKANFFNSADDLAEWADILSVHCPLNESSHHLINQTTLRKLGSEGYLINTARGPVVDEATLANALHNGIIAGAGIDVFEKEPEVHPDLYTAPNAVLLPHIGSATHKTRTRMVELATSAIDGVLQGKPESIDNLII